MTSPKAVSTPTHQEPRDLAPQRRYAYHTASCHITAVALRPSTSRTVPGQAPPLLLWTTGRWSEGFGRHKSSPMPGLPAPQHMARVLVQSAQNCPVFFYSWPVPGGRGRKSNDAGPFRIILPRAFFSGGGEEKDAYPCQSTTHVNDDRSGRVHRLCKGLYKFLVVP